MKKTFITFSLAIFSLYLLPSCENIILGEDEANNPENNFELLWNDFDKHYALFGVKNIDWDALYSTYRPQVTSGTSDDELWDITTQMLDQLNDGHTILQDPANNKHFESGGSFIAQAIAEFSLPLIYNTYLDYLKSTSEEGFSYGKIKDKDIGYIHLFGVEGDHPEIIDDVLNELSQHKAIILDLRNNGGGADDYAHRIAGAFADGEHFIYTVQTRNGVNHNDFDAPTFWYTKPEGNSQFLKPVILLTDRFTASGAEILSLNMQAFDHVTVMGDSTAGDFSDQGNSRFLPNGWIYHYSVQLYLLPSGESLEGIGIVPEVYIKNTEEDIDNGNDLVLENAIQYLFDEYGIE